MKIYENQYASPANNDPEGNFNFFGEDVKLSPYDLSKKMGDAVQYLKDTLKEDYPISSHFTPVVYATTLVLFGGWEFFLQGENEDGPIWTAFKVVGKFDRLHGSTDHILKKIFSV